MALDAVIAEVRQYLALLREHGFQIERAVLFGSHARGETRAGSDIDLLLVSAGFEKLTWKQEEMLWSLTAQIDSRIEPIPCSERQWWDDQVSPLIQIARLEGIVIKVDTEVVYPAQRDFVELAGQS
ncbi:MAG: nucleotidyltransferase domain-containing protein [Anaerolineae bacterium]